MIPRLFVVVTVPLVTLSAYVAQGWTVEAVIADGTFYRLLWECRLSAEVICHYENDRSI